MVWTMKSKRLPSIISIKALEVDEALLDADRSGLEVNRQVLDVDLAALRPRDLADVLSGIRTPASWLTLSLSEPGLERVLSC